MRAASYLSTAQDFFQLFMETFYFRFPKQIKGLFKASRQEIGVMKPEPLFKIHEAIVYKYPSLHENVKDVVFIVYATINRPYILDLYKGHSLIEHLYREGFQVFLMDWGIYDDSSRVTIEDQILGRLHPAMERVLEQLNAKKINTVGYCQGGTFILILAALFPNLFKNIVLYNTPVDFTFGGLFQFYRHVPHLLLEHFLPEWNVHLEWTDVPEYPLDHMDFSLLVDGPEWFESLRWLRAANLWENDAVPLAREAFNEWVILFYQDNRLVQNRLFIDGEKVELEKIRHPVLSIVAEVDDISPRQMAAPIKKLKRGAELCIPGGHLSTTAGHFAKYHSWPAMVKWLQSAKM